METTSTYSEQRLWQGFLEYCIKRLEQYNEGEGEALDGKTLEVIGKMIEKMDLTKPTRSGYDPLMDKDAEDAAAALLKKYGTSTS